ncbi:hypothetical protein IFM89_010948 [Coptis chinensis]|uniref:CCHC-type domain-containing protein n=1 Tax=Coptis chinensis TaxID=261450 RepID=A0A835M5B3_9MAGN|nr:hypothetical protein IFM89_010948 [Coptis chinensis]
MPWVYGYSSTIKRQAKRRIRQLILEVDCMSARDCTSGKLGSPSFLSRILVVALLVQCHLCVDCWSPPQVSPTTLTPPLSPPATTQNPTTLTPPLSPLATTQNPTTPTTPKHKGLSRSDGVIRRIYLILLKLILKKKKNLKMEMIGSGGGDQYAYSSNFGPFMSDCTGGDESDSLEKEFVTNAEDNAEDNGDGDMRQPPVVNADVDISMLSNNIFEKEEMEKINPEDLVNPPEFKPQVGRPKKQRIRDEDEPKATSKVLRKCGKCGELNHNTRTCDARNNGTRPKKRAKKIIIKDELQGNFQQQQEAAPPSVQQQANVQQQVPPQQQYAPTNVQQQAPPNVQQQVPPQQQRATRSTRRAPQQQQVPPQ